MAGLKQIHMNGSTMLPDVGILRQISDFENSLASKNFHWWVGGLSVIFRYQ